MTAADVDKFTCTGVCTAANCRVAFAHLSPTHNFPVKFDWHSLFAFTEWFINCSRANERAFACLCMYVCVCPPPQNQRNEFPQCSPTTTQLFVRGVNCGLRWVWVARFFLLLRLSGRWSSTKAIFTGVNNSVDLLPVDALTAAEHPAKQ